MDSKSICTVGYTKPQLFTRSQVFFELTGVRRCAGFSCVAEVPGGAYEYALLNFESDPCGGVAELSALCSKCRSVVIYTDSPLKALYVQVFKQYDNCSLVICPRSREIEECRAALERKQTFFTVAARKCLEEQLPHSMKAMGRFTRQQLLALFCMLKKMAMKETAEVLETTEKSARQTVEKMKKAIGGDYEFYEVLEMYSWLL